MDIKNITTENLNFQLVVTIIDHTACLIKFNYYNICKTNENKFVTNKLMKLSNSMQMINKFGIFKGRNLLFRIIWYSKYS